MPLPATTRAAPPPTATRSSSCSSTLWLASRRSRGAATSAGQPTCCHQGLCNFMLILDAKEAYMPPVHPVQPVPLCWAAQQCLAVKCYHHVSPLLEHCQACAFHAGALVCPDFCILTRVLVPSLSTTQAVITSNDLTQQSSCKLRSITVFCMLCPH